jgi:predicted RNA-binding Zn-ribbon protein involved in translation (DUF1610 family)
LSWNEDGTPRSPISKIKRTAAEHAEHGTIECPHCGFDTMLRDGCRNADGSYSCPFCDTTFGESVVG